jgi:hypothetical protein
VGGPLGVFLTLVSGKPARGAEKSADFAQPLDSFGVGTAPFGQAGRLGTTGQDQDDASVAGGRGHMEPLVMHSLSMVFAMIVVSRRTSSTSSSRT